MVGRFKSKAANIGDIPRITITTPIKIDELKEIMYEPNEYVYNNDDSISKYLVLFMQLFLIIISKNYIFVYMLFSEQFNFIYFGPKSGKDKSVPFVVVPHGGPHSSFTNVFSLDHSFLVSAGIVSY